MKRRSMRWEPYSGFLARRKLPPTSTNSPPGETRFANDWYGSEINSGNLFPV